MPSQAMPAVVTMIGALHGLTSERANVPNRRALQPARHQSDAAVETCKCTITAEKLGHLSRPKLATAGRTPTRYLFLVGYPFTGTTALHELLGLSKNVSTLCPELGREECHINSPAKEGWAQIGWKYHYTIPEQWSQDTQFDWARLDSFYHKHWNLKRPLLLESTPTEIAHVNKLHARFSRHGKVRFIVLAHSLCAHNAETKGSPLKTNACPDKAMQGDPNCWARRASTIMEIKKRYGDDALVVRYEDMCLHWDSVLDALDTWEPELHLRKAFESSLLDETIRLATTGHVHSHQTIPEYCAEHKIPRWTAGQELPLPAKPDASNAMHEVNEQGLKDLRYDAIDACVSS